MIEFHTTHPLCSSLCERHLTAISTLSASTQRCAEFDLDVAFDLRTAHSIQTQCASHDVREARGTQSRGASIVLYVLALSARHAGMQLRRRRAEGLATANCA